MTNHTTLVVLISVLVVSCACQQNCKGSPNTLPIGVSSPVPKQQVFNGSLSLQTDVSPAISVIHMYGSAYQMGFAHGTLMKTQLHALYADMEGYLERGMDPYLKFLPPHIRHLIEMEGVTAALNLTYRLTLPYIPEHFIQEMHGLADGSGIAYDRVAQLHMFPELIKAHCSESGSWGNATINSTSTAASLYQLRALDWDTTSPLQQYPAMLVYHPTDGHAFSLVSWVGFIGALTGYSSAPVGICEKVWLSYNGSSSRTGIPWHFLLRDILQFDSTVDDALTRIENAHRTCSIFVGVGATHPVNRFTIVQYAHDGIVVNDDQDSPSWPEHPKLNNVVYVDKHKQPSHDPCMGSLLQKYYGALDTTAYIRHVCAELQTGDMHAAVYDYAKHLVYVSNASPANATGGGAIPAYDRKWVRFDMEKLFSLPPPPSMLP